MGLAEKLNAMDLEQVKKYKGKEMIKGIVGAVATFSALAFAPGFYIGAYVIGGDNSGFGGFTVIDEALNGLIGGVVTESIALVYTGFKGYNTYMAHHKQKDLENATPTPPSSTQGATTQ